MRWVPILALATGCEATESTATTPTVETVYSGETDGGTWWVAWSPTPEPLPFNEPFDITAIVTAVEGGEATPSSFAIDAFMPAHGHGMQVVPVVESTSTSEWTAQGFVLFMPGAWELVVDVDDEQVRLPVACCGE